MKQLVIPTKFTAIDQFSGTIAKMKGSTEAFAAYTERRFRKLGNESMAVGRSALYFGAAVAAPLVLAAREAINFEDQLANVQKTTGLAGQNLSKFGEQVLSYSKKTRTSINDLLKISEIGGQMGVLGEDIFDFTKSMDKFNVALGGDFSGGVEEATRSISVLKNLFKETRDLDIASAITKAGDIVNALSAKGVMAPELTDFMARIGQLPEAIRPSIQATASLGAVMNKAGITSEIGARGISDILLTASKHIPAFAKQMSMGTEKLSQLINSHPEQFLTKFSESLKGVKGDKLGLLLESLHIGDVGAIKVVGALSEKVKLFNEFLGISSEQLNKGGSLLAEYNTKNNTSAASIGKVKNQIKSLAITIGQGLLPVVSNLVGFVTPMISSISSWMKENKELATGIIGLTVAVASFSLAVSAGSFIVAGFSKAIVFGSKIVQEFILLQEFATTAQTLLNKAWAISPIGTFILGVTALYFAMDMLIPKLSGVSREQKLNNEINQRAVDLSIDQRVEAMSLFSRIKQLKVGTDEYKSVLLQIDKLSPGIVEKYNLQKGAIDDLSRAEKNLMYSIMERAKVQAREEILKEKFKSLVQSEISGPSMMNQVLGAFSGFGGQGAKYLQKQEEEQLKQDIQQLEFQMTQKYIPQAGERAIRNEKQEIVFDFRNVPEFLLPAFMGMQPSEKSNLSIKPKTTTTRK